jgi:hypothetical protein
MFRLSLINLVSIVTKKCLRKPPIARLKKVCGGRASEPQGGAFPHKN